MSVAELERQLQQHWRHELLPIYADELQRAGDPRGVIIACDLLHNGPPSDELWEHRADAVDAWLGPEDWDGLDRVIVSDRFGVLDVRASEPRTGTDGLDELFAAPYGRFVQTLRLYGSVAFFERAIAVIAAAERPWLRRLVFTRVIHQDAPAECTSIRGDALVAAAPNLRILEVSCSLPESAHFGFHRPVAPLFDDLVLPAVRLLDVTGYDELRGLAHERWPTLERLAFAFGEDLRFGDGSVTDLAALLHAFPALRHLDLSRNEPSTPRWSGAFRHQAGDLRVYPALQHLDLARIVELRLPSLRNDDDVGALQAALDRMPELARVEIARTYPVSPHTPLHHPTATIVVPEPCAWPPADRVSASQELVLDRDLTPIRVRDAIAIMEVGYTALFEPARAAWNQIWSFVHAWSREPRARTLPASVLCAALRPIEELSRVLYDRGMPVPHIASEYLEDHLRRRADVTMRLRG